jgi:hypothetical protein
VVDAVWLVDGVEVPAFADNASQTFDAVFVKTGQNDLMLGSHTVTVIVTIDGADYSKTVALEVTE